MEHIFLSVGDSLMVDKGFLIESELQKIGLDVNIPPFAQANKQLPASDVIQTKKNSSSQSSCGKGNSQNKEI